jgi:hypothetical protein
MGHSVDRIILDLNSSFYLYHQQYKPFLSALTMDFKTVLLGLTPFFITLCLFFGTKNGFYDSDDYHGNGSAH